MGYGGQGVLMVSAMAVVECLLKMQEERSLVM